MLLLNSKKSARDVCGRLGDKGERILREWNDGDVTMVGWPLKINIFYHPDKHWIIPMKTLKNDDWNIGFLMV